MIKEQNDGLAPLTVVTVAIGIQGHCCTILRLLTLSSVANIDFASLNPDICNYTLIVDSKTINTRKIVVAK